MAPLDVRTRSIRFGTWEPDNFSPRRGATGVAAVAALCTLAVLQSPRLPSQRRGPTKTQEEGPSSSLAEPGSLINGRYVVEYSLGIGGMGSVFAAHDGELDRPVAIKVLVGSRRKDRRASERVLREARAMARVAHPACVQVYDYGLDAHFGPYLVMERLEGEDLSRFLHKGRTLSVPFALNLFEQICLAVDAVHAVGIVHRDIKPGNIFVLGPPPDHSQTPSLKLFDFGIARDSDAENQLSYPGKTLGTLAYMAPERWPPCNMIEEGSPDIADIRADVYALGTILYEMLSGGPPFRAATQADLRLAILHDSPVPLGACRSDLPERVSAAVDRALSKRAEDRFHSVRAMAAALGLAMSPQGRARGSTTPLHEPDPPSHADGLVSRLGSAADREPGEPPIGKGPAYVGRRELLATLANAAQTAGADAQVIWIEGPSGIGKTALLQELRRRLQAETQSLVLFGHARRSGSIPFPALEEAIDQLGSHLLRLSPEVTDVLLPKRRGKLAQLFPNLTQVPAIARAAANFVDGGRAMNERLEAFDVLRELLIRLAERQPVVLAIDDVQWIDSDSRALLCHVLGGDRPPSLLVVGALRDADDALPPDIRKLETSLRKPVRREVLGPLSAEESGVLLRARWRDLQPPDQATAARLVADSGGVPFFVEILATDTLSSSETVRGGGNTELDETLRSRFFALPADVRRMVELVCVTSCSLRADLIMKMTGPKAEVDLAAAYAGSFIRLARDDHGWVLEPYHDTIREVVLRTLSADARRARHRDLADALGADPAASSELLVEHLAGCGDAGAAAGVALRAGEAAHQHLAFDRAAALFGLALALGTLDDAGQVRVGRQRAAALLAAGRRKECGEALLQAAPHCLDPFSTEAMREEAGRHLLLAGDVQNGLLVLTPALERAGVRVPSSLAETIEATGAALSALGRMGVRMPDRRAAPRSDGERSQAWKQIDLCLCLAQGLAHIDLRVVPFACQALLAALEAGELSLLQRASALFVINTVEYVPNPMVAPALELAQTLTETAADPYAAALLDAAVAEHAHFESDFLTAEAAFERAERTLLRSCPDATRELAMVRDLAVFVQYAQKGDFATQLERTTRWLTEADAARDVYHASMLRVAHAIVWIAHDEPERARSELRRAQSEWLGEGGVLEVAAALYHDVIDRYEERDLAPEIEDPRRLSLLRSPAAETPFLRGYLALQSSWKRLRAIAAGRGGREESATVSDEVANLRALGLPIWSAVADALQANLDYLLGSDESALLCLEQAEQKFRRLSMLCLAACARMRRGEFTRGELGTRLLGEAGSELRALGVRNPSRWTRAYWSMFDTSAASAPTRDL